MTERLTKKTDTVNPSSLEELREAILAGHYTDWEMTDLPTFGGEEPHTTLRVWSWDERRILYGPDYQIISREEFVKTRDM